MEAKKKAAVHLAAHQPGPGSVAVAALAGWLAGRRCMCVLGASWFRPPVLAKTKVSVFGSIRL